MDAGACLPREPPRLRPVYDPNVTMQLPAPCYLVGRSELVYVYFGSGFLIPILALIYVQFAWLKRKILTKLQKQNLLCTHSEVKIDEDDLDKEGIKKSGVDRIKLLMEAKAKQSAVLKFFMAAASPQSLLGQVLMGIAVLCGTISLVTYLSSVSVAIDSVEFCGTLPNMYQALDFLANIYMFFYFIVRFIGTDKKISILHSMHSIVDYFTIPAVLISVGLNRYFTGFAFFRAYNCMWIVDILSNRGVFRNANTIKLAKLVLLVVSCLMIAAGFLHLVENMGDPWLLANKATFNGQTISFWRCYLYLYGRVTLLDLSGMRIMTMLGRIIIYGFQILALGIVSKAIPQIILLVKIQPEWDKDYQSPVMFLHVIVCGYVRASNMASFLKEFYNRDRETSEYFKILILDENEPDEDMRYLMEQYFNKMDYRRGTCMKLKDLNRVKVGDAEAVLILADRTAADCDSEDAANIMRVVAVKNWREETRVIVQILQYHNKAYLQNIPSWDSRNGDIVICISELRLGLLAQSCVAPGFSTLMANFFTTRSFDDNKKCEEPWMVDYVRGTALELYSREFSPAFVGMDFSEAFEFCYRRLKILLLAVHARPLDTLSTPQINPPSYITINQGSCGYFIADTAQEADRAKYYCVVCHEGVQDVSLVSRCTCEAVPSNVEKRQLIKQPSALSRMLSCRPDPALEAKIWSFIRRYPRTPLTRSLQTIPQDEDVADRVKEPELLYDSTGMFHWQPAHVMEDVVMNRLQAAQSDFQNHIVVCVLSQANSQIIGLGSLVLPLRSSNIGYSDLQDIVILGDVKFLEKEWLQIHNMPKIHIVKGTALNRSDLRSVNLNACKMCVILGAPGSNDKNIADATLIDKNVILATLNVRAMRFSQDENDLIVYPNGDLSGTSRLTQGTGHEVPLLTDLMRDSNVQYLEQDDRDVPGTEFYCSVPYAGGRAFAASVLDLLMITSFYNPPIIKVFHAMIFGGASLELERIIAEGAGLIGGSSISMPAEMKDQIKVIQFALSYGPFRHHAVVKGQSVWQYGTKLPRFHQSEPQKFLAILDCLWFEDSSYGGLVVDALFSKGLVVLGIYRQNENGDTPESPRKRYVIGNPSENFVLHASDEVFALQRSDWLPGPKTRAPLQPFEETTM